MCPSVFHPELDGKGSFRRTGVATDLIRGGGGVLGVNKLQPSIVGIGEVVVPIAQQVFPSGGIVGFAAAKIQVKKSGGIPVSEFRPDVGLGVMGRDRKGGAGFRMPGFGGPHDAGKPGAVSSGGGLKLHAHVDLRTVLDQLDGERDTLFGGAALQDIPLGLEHVGIVRDHVKGK